MKTTPFTETHISLGAKMHEFAGYNMPIEYSGIIDEHLTVCQVRMLWTFYRQSPLIT